MHVPINLHDGRILINQHNTVKDGKKNRVFTASPCQAGVDYLKLVSNLDLDQNFNISRRQTEGHQWR